MIKHLYIDIETIPAQRPDVMEEITEGLQAGLVAALADIHPPGNYKKQETIDQWMAEEAPKQAQALREAAAADIDAAYRKTGLDGAYGQIAVIGFALDDQPAVALYGDWENQYCEQELLESFGCTLTDLIPRKDEMAVCVVGHNVCSFDLRFVVQRSVVNGVPPHRIIAAAAQAKPWEAQKVFDTMVQWAGTGNRISLDKLCKALSVPTPKTNITGATVWDAVRAGRIDGVAEYCKRDIAATRAVHRLMTFQVDSAPVVFEDVAF